ncbi:MAG: type II secretion system GspH family protein [Puniceicoccales bacterium]|jgi:prepilin-type N-terminal cleavage/methylation domain-containing protein|nr:type II secretion system GspH family protein [Puniceicoccales bacterium]
MKRGFSLLEVVLAIGILGFSLPVLLTYMAESASSSERRMQGILVSNAGKNVQNVLSVSSMAPALDSNHQAYCGYKGGIFVVADEATGFDGPVFVLGRNGVVAGANGSVEETTYALYPWDTKRQSPRLTSPFAVIRQFAVAASLGSAG